MQVQAAPRYQRRLPCRVRLGAGQYTGLILNLSRSGLFVETGAVAAPGERVEVSLQAPTATPDIVLSSQVVWKRAVAPPQGGRLESRPTRSEPQASGDRPLGATPAGGLGVQIQYAPEAYYSLLEAVERLESQVPRVRRSRGEGESIRDARGPERARYRVRLQQIGSQRSRTLEIDAASEPEARRRGLDLAGPDWSITQIDRSPKRHR